MESKHTPGPWTLGRVRQEDEDYWTQEVCTSDGYCIFRCQEPDAELIVRAVNSHEALLAACKLAIGFAVDFRQRHEADWMNFPEVGHLYAVMHKAIAQAEEPINGK